MSSVDVKTSNEAAPGVTPVDMKLEVVMIGVTDIDRAKAFYQNLGWRFDADIMAGRCWWRCRMAASAFHTWRSLIRRAVRCFSVGGRKSFRVEATSSDWSLQGRRSGKVS